MNINQKVVIVTGSGGGIGEGIAKHFAAHGAKVLVNDINSAAGQKVVKDIQAAGGTAAFFAADVTRSDDVKAMVQDCIHCWHSPSPWSHLVQRLERCGDHHQQIFGSRIGTRQHPSELHQPGVQPRHGLVG